MSGLAGRWRTLWLVLAGTAILLLAIRADGFPTVFTDTDDYYSQGVELWQKARVEFLGVKPEPDTRSAADKRQAAIDAELSRTQMAARSTTYSLFLYGLESAGTLWLVAAAQAASAAWTLLLVLRCAVPRAGPRSYLAVMAALAAGSTLPFFAGFAMPDAFAGVGVLGVALLTLYWAELSRTERAGVAVLLSFALVTHTSHELLAITLVPVAAVLLWWVRAGWRSSAVRLAAVTATILVAIAINSGYGMIVEAQTGQRLRHQPFLMARTLADGPGRAYLRHACSHGEHYALCRFQHLPLDDSEDILWSDLPTSGVFLIANYATRVQLEIEEPRFILQTIAYDPWAQIKASAANWAKQLTLIGIDDVVRNPHYYMTDDYWARTYLPDMIMAVAHCGRRGDACALWLTPAPTGDEGGLNGRSPPAPRPALFHGAVVLLSLALTGAALWPLRSRAATPVGRQMLAFAVLILAAVLLNAGITGVLSGPFARYQARLIWLIPALAGVALAARVDGQQAFRQLDPFGRQRIEHAE